MHVCVCVWSKVVDPVPPLFGTVDDTAETTYDEPPEAAAMRKARIAEATYNLDQFKQIAKGVDAQHEMTAFRPEECIVFQSHTFVAYEFVTYFNVESYGEWVRDSIYDDVFRWHKQMLRHFTSTAPPSTNGKPWVLKTPFYAGMLKELVAEYPVASIVMTHRRPIQAMSSLSSLQMRLRSVSSDLANPKAIAEETFSLWDALAAREVEMREAWASGDLPGPGGGIVDVGKTCAQCFSFFHWFLFSSPLFYSIF